MMMIRRCLKGRDLRVAERCASSRACVGSWCSITSVEMINSVTKFLEKVDQKAGETLGNSSQHITTTTSQSPTTAAAVTASDRGTPAESARSAAAAEVSDTTFGLPSDRLLFTDAAMAHRDHALLRMQRDYEELASRAKELSAALERRTNDHEELRATYERALADAERLRQELTVCVRERESRDGELGSLRTALHDAMAGAEAARQDTDLFAAQKRQLEAVNRALTEELQEYRRRSATVIAAKDAQIAELSSRRNPLDASESSVETLTSQLEASRQKIAELESALVAARSEVAQLKVIVNERAAVSASTASELAAAQRREREAMESSRVAQAMYDGEVVSHNGTRQRLEAVISEKEEELRLLRKQLAQASRTLSSSATSDAVTDWERRAKDLAELVMEKQAAFEAKRGEAERWKALLESAQQRLREMELVSLSTNAASSTSGSSGAHHRIINISADDKERGEAMIGEFSRSQFFGTLSRRGKIGAQITTAAQQLDKVSLTAGRLLRRSSVLRICAILYVIALQLWCFVAVSLASVPPVRNEPQH